MKELNVEQARRYLKEGYHVLITNPEFDDCVVEAWARHGEGMHPVDDESGLEFMGFDEITPADRLWLVEGGY